ncbi:MAG: 6-carboxytetrahydropterin synthase [Deltaproteobacteria bacterium]|nr:6-carboxytetrahydropterin synthase [Deltaproteobacteria bacterium]
MLRRRHGIRLDKQYFNFGSAHFLIFANGTREELHGHNYRAELEIDAELDAGHLVADFIVVKPLFKAACDALDHRTLLPTRHPSLHVTKQDRQILVEFAEPDGQIDRFSLPARDVRLLDIANTSSELLAGWLLDQVLLQLPQKLPDLKIQRILVRVEESPGQSAVDERFFDADA